MGRFTKMAVAGVTASLFMVGGASAQVISPLENFEEGSNQNLFGDYWYFYDDQDEKTSVADLVGPSAVGTSVVHSATVKVTNGKRELLFTPDKSIVPDGANSTERAAVLDFTWGQTFRTAYDNTSIESARNPSLATCPPTNGTSGCYDFEQFVGIGTNLVPDGSVNGPAGIGSATQFRFWAKTGVGTLSIRVALEQSDIPKPGAHWGAYKEIDASWKPYVIAIPADLEQPTWVADQGYEIPFNMSKVTKVGWQAQAAFPVTDATKSHKLYIDEIDFVGFRFVAADMCEECIVTERPADTHEFSLFATNAQNVLNWYWYAYDDTKTVDDDGVRGNSAFGGDGVDCDSEWFDADAGECGLVPIEGAIKIEFEMGEPLTIGGDPVQPFVGLGTNLYDADSDAPEYYNAAEAGVKGLYFEYMTNVRKLSFEVQDAYDAEGDRPAAAVWYIDIPGTAAGEAPEWKKALVPFSKLTTHTGWESVKEWQAANPTKTALDLTRLAKFQFKHQGKTDGDLAIRNVYFAGGEAVSVRNVANRNAGVAGMRATYNRGVIGVNWNAASNVVSGKIDLVNIKGRVISSARIANVSGNRITANLGSDRIPTGMYFVRIDARDASGKRIVQQAPLSIVR